MEEKKATLWSVTMESQSKSEDEEGYLISAAKKDTEAFGKLYDKYYQDVFRYINRRVMDISLAEDLTSNTFLSAFRHLKTYKWRRIPFGAWLIRIAKNEIRLHHRNQKRSSVKMAEVSSSSHMEDAAMIEEYDVLYQAILKLSSIHKDIIILRFFEDRTIPEISEITGQKEGTVKSRLHRGLEQLREMLIRQGFFK